MTPVFQITLNKDGTFKAPWNAIVKWVVKLAKKTDTADLVIRMPFKQRSHPQNRYYWGVVIHVLAQEWGYEKGELHELLLHRFSIESRQGQPPKILRSRDMSVREFRDYVSTVKRWALTEYGITVPESYEEEEN